MNPLESKISNLSLYGRQVRQFMSYFALAEKRPDLVFLTEIIQRFTSFPYENISKIIKFNHNFDNETKIRLPEEIMEDHLDYNLGGTCFSLTYFLQVILFSNGFICYPVMADMRAGQNIHCCLIVDLKGKKYLVDPGYLLSQPMEINPSKPRLYRTEHTGVELLFDEREQAFNLYTFHKNDIKWRYRFKDRPTPPDEFLQHWYASFTKNAMHGICLTKITDRGLVYVHKYFMRETSFHGKRNVNIRQNYHAAIQEIFGIKRELVENALAAISENMAKERESGLHIKRESGVFNASQ